MEFVVVFLLGIWLAFAGIAYTLLVKGKGKNK